MRCLDGRESDCGVKVRPVGPGSCFQPCLRATSRRLIPSTTHFLPPAEGFLLHHHINIDNTTDECRRNWIEDSREVVDIENVRGSEDQYKLDNASLQLGRQDSKHTRFLDDERIEAEYHLECIELIVPPRLDHRFFWLKP